MFYQESYLLIDIEPDLIVMRECQIKAASIASSNYAKRFKAQIDELLLHLKQIIKFYEKWRAMQKLWAYMSPIFHGTVNMEQQMEEQYDTFMRMDRQYRQAVMILDSGRRVTYKRFYSQGNLKDSVSPMLKNLELLMRSLTRYIEEKREKFPRFYFLSNEQIIEMSGVVQEVSNIEKNFHKMFEGIDRLIIVYREHDMTVKQRQAL